MLPPSIRRRRKTMDHQKRMERRMSYFYMLGLLVMGAGFLFFHASYRRQQLQQQQQPYGGRVVRNSHQSSQRLRGSTRIWVTPDAQPFDQDHVASSAKHLVIVAGHSVIVSGNLEDAGLDESVWWLLDYQRGRGMPQAILGHIQAGINEANQDPEALLVFSGGETRPLTGPLSEGTSYFEVSDAMKLWPAGSTVRARTVAEEFATDSFENLLFSICRFREVTGNYPEKITMVSFSFKQRRFETLHTPALQWPTNRFKYVGYDPPASTGFDLEVSTKGEEENAAKPFELDPYGCHSEILQNKRKGRNPFHRTAPYQLSCPEMKELLGHCGPELIPKDMVPWSSLQ